MKFKIWQAGCITPRMSSSLVSVRKFFRSVVLVGSVLLLLPLPLFASQPASQSITLAWTPSPDDSVAGYKLYYGLQSGQYTTCVDVGDVDSATFSVPVAGATYYLAATTYDMYGNESDFSDEIIINPQTSGTANTTPPALTSVQQVDGVFGFSVNGVTGNQYVIQASTDLIHWVPLTTNTVPFTFTDPDAAKYNQRFYRSLPFVLSGSSGFVSAASVSQTSNLFSFSVDNVVGTQYVVQASTDLVNWVSLETNTAPFTFTDPDTAKYSQRFYRSVAL
jgi:hypothetical protein